MDENRRKDGPRGPHDAAAPQDARWELPGYTHGRELGAGAAGRVVLASHDGTGTPVAIKYLTGGQSGHANLRTEAELLATLSSPHVTRLYEYVEGPLGAAIVMELVDGVSLRDLLRAEGATTPEAALTVLKGSLLGLADAHRAGVVHRDYKPGNVLVTTEGVSKLVDFGIALRDGATGDIAGTPAYMAPEQWAGEPASPAGDVYAATATFYECLTGAKPYAGTTLMELAVQHTEADIPAEHAPEPLRPLIRSGLAKTPHERPAGAAALVTELESIAVGSYGPQWEENGRRHLAGLVALLPLLLPRPHGHAAGNTSLATTTLPELPPRDPSAGAPEPSAGRRFGPRAKLLSAVVGLVLVGGGLAGIAAAGVSDSTGTTALASPEATTTFGSAEPSAAAPPAPESASPSPSPSLSASPSPSPSASASPSPSPSASPSKKPPTAKPSPSASPSASVTPSPSPSPVLVVSLVSVTPTCGYTGASRASVAIRSDNAAAGKLTVTWYNAAGAPVTTTTVALPAGKATGTYDVPAPVSRVQLWSVAAATDPAAAKGQNVVRTCPPVIG